MMTEILAQIRADKFCAGLVLWNDKVVEAAPIVRYMRNWPRDRVRNFCKSKGWQISIVWKMQRH